MTTKLMLAKRVGELIVREGLLSDEGKPRRTIPLKELAERLCGSKTRLSNLRNREWVELESGEVVRLSTFIVAKRGRPVGELTAKIAVEEGRPQRSAVEVRRQLMNRASSEKEQARMEKEIRRGRERRRIAQIIREKPDLSDAEVARLVSSSRAGPRTLSDKERTARSVRAELAKGHDGPT